MGKRSIGVAVACLLALGACGGQGGSGEESASAAEALSPGAPVAVIALVDGSTSDALAPAYEDFDGTRSYTRDPNTWITVLHWEFGDGTPGRDAAWVQHVYTTPGTYIATLTVTDNRGNRGQASVTLHVRSRATLPPPVAQARIVDGTRACGVAPLLVDFDGTTSHPQVPNAWITDFQWDFGDGTPRSRAGWVQHVYRAPGRYTATLTVHDSNGNAGSASLTVTALASPAEACEVIPGSTRWMETWWSNSLVQFMTADAGGNLLTLNNAYAAPDGSGASSGQKMVIAKHAPDGALLWWKMFTATSTGGIYTDVSGFTMTANPAGELYVAGGVSGRATFGATSIADGPFLLKLTAGGEVEWARPVPLFASAMTVDRYGDLVMVAGPFIGKFAPDGTERWGGLFGAAGEAWDLHGVTTDSAGRIIAAGALNQGDAGGQPVVVWIDGNGHELARKPLGGHGNILALSTNSRGQYLVSGYFSGTLTWGGSTLTHADPAHTERFIAMGRLDGAEYWIKDFGTSDTDMALPAAGDHGNFLVSIRGPQPEGCYGLTLSGFPLDPGVPPLAPTWSRRLVPNNCPGPSFSPYEVQSGGLVMLPNGLAALAGAWSGTVDFGMGPRPASGLDGFLLELNP